MEKEQPAVGTAKNSVPAVARGITARAESGDVVGMVAILLHADGTASRVIVGTARDDRHRAAGLALSLANGVLQPD